MNNDTMSGPSPGWRGLVLAVLASAAMGGCAFLQSADSDSIPVPEDEGIYAYQGDDDLVRLDGDLEWEKETWDERSELAPDSTFVIRDPVLAELSGTPEQAIGLRRVAWVRSEISETGITPVTGAAWRAVTLPALAVDAEYARDTESPDVVQLRPGQPLEPGLYSLYMDTEQGSRKARFGVGWPELDKQAYASKVCVDRYVGQTDAYRLCQAQTSAGSSNDLQIYLVKPETRTTGTGRSMIVSGVILNGSNKVQDVPVLEGELRNANDDVIATWRFKADSSRLEPGQSTSFRSEVGETAQNIHSVHVDFDNTAQ